MDFRVILKSLQKLQNVVENLLVLTMWDPKFLACCRFYELQGLREEKNEQVYTRQKIYIHESFLEWEYGVLQGNLSMKWIWKFFVLFSTIRGFLEVFYFPSAFIVI